MLRRMVSWISREGYKRVLLLDYNPRSPHLLRAAMHHPSMRFEVYDHHAEPPPVERWVYEEGRTGFLTAPADSGPLPSNVSVNMYPSALKMNRALMPSKSRYWRTIAVVGAICDRDPSAAKYFPRYGRIADGLDCILRYYNSSSLALQLLEAGMFGVLEENAGLLEKSLEIGYETVGNFAVFGRRGKRKLPLSWTNKVLDYLLRKTGCRYAVGCQSYREGKWDVIVKKDWLEGRPFDAGFLEWLRGRLQRVRLGTNLAWKNPDTLVIWVPSRKRAEGLVEEIVKYEGEI
jgi:hypothetical protein